MQAAGVAPADISTILLVGGSSRIPLVAELLASEFRRPIARGTHPQHEVALGAAVVASQPKADGALPTTPPPVPTPVVRPRVQPDSEDNGSPPKSGGRPNHAGSTPSSADASPPGALRPRRRGRRSRFLIVVATSVALVALAATTVFALSRKGGESVQDDLSSSATTSTTSNSTVEIPTQSSVSGTGPAQGLIDLPRSAQPLPDQIVISPRIVQENHVAALVDATNGETVELIHVPGGLMFAPDISPDRRSIIYVDQGTAKLHVIAADGSGDRALLQNLDGCDTRMLRPGWNPVNPDELALSCIDLQGKYRLRIIRLDGEVVRELNVGQPVVDDLTYAPDGKHVAFWAGQSAAWPDGGAIYTMATDGSEPPVKITDGTTDADPIFSPDGTRILFRRIVDDGTAPRNMDLYVMNSDGTGLKPLAPHPADDLDPAWSPDGSQIVFTSNRGDGPNDIGFTHHLLMSSDGQNIRRLAPDSPFPEELVMAWGNR